MKNISLIIVTGIILFSSCTSQKNLAYLNNLPESNGEETFLLDFPNYSIQPRDILYITIKAMTPDGRVTDFLSVGSASSSLLDASGGYLTGYVVSPEGNIIIPAVGTIKVSGLSLDETRKLIQAFADKVFKNSTVECKLQNFKYTIIGQVNNPGTFLNSSNYLTVFEAIGRAGGIGDYGDRHKLLVIRSTENGARTFNLNLQDKKILSSEVYFLMPNDIVIVQPLSHKIFNMNLPTISFIISTVTSTITMTLLLINYVGK